MDCQPTYEELKLKLQPRRDGLERNCQPTYEELKLGSAFSIDDGISANCQPTYEELKPSSGSCFTLNEKLLPAYL